MSDYTDRKNISIILIKKIQFFIFVIQQYEGEFTTESSIKKD
jgi:hypothetical protein